MSDGSVEINSRIDDSGVMRGIKRIKGKLQGLDKSLIKTAALGAAIKIAPAVVPAIAAATAAALALGSAFMAAGVGVLGFGAVAVTTLKDVFEASSKIAEAEEKLAAATNAKERAAALEEMRQATLGLSDAQKQALKSLQEFKSFWGDFAKSFEEPVVSVFSYSLETLQYILQQLKPAFMGATKAIVGLMEGLNTALRADDVKGFFQWINGFAGPAIESFGKTFGYVMRGFLNLMTAFAPLSTSIQSWLLNMAKAFSEWSASISGSDAFQKFINYVRENGPKLMKIVGNLVKAIITLGVLLAPAGEIALDILLRITEFLTGDFAAALGEKGAGKMMQFVEQIKLGFSIFMEYLTQLKPLIDMFVESTVARIQLISQFFIQAFQIIWPYIQPLLTEIVAFIGEKVNQIVQFWKENGAQIMLAVQNAFNFILAIIQFVMPAVMFIIRIVWDSIKGIINGALKIIMGAIKIFTGIFTGDFKMMWEGIKQLFVGAFQFLWNLFNLMLLGRIVGGIKAFVMGGVKLFKMFGTAVKGTFKDFINNIVTLFHYFRSTGTSIWRAIVDTVKNVIRTFVSAAKANFRSFLDDATTKFNKVKDAIMTPIKAAADFIKKQVDRIKGFFSGMKINLPKIKLPHFRLSGKLDLTPPSLSVPKLSVNWYKDGGLFPANSPRLVGVGDASVPEAALPLKPSVLGMIGRKIAETMPQSQSSTDVSGILLPNEPMMARINIAGHEADSTIEFITKKQEGMKRRSQHNRGRSQ